MTCTQEPAKMMSRMTDRQIAVTGTGRISVKPDWIVISVHMKATDPDYAAAVALGEKQLQEIQTAVLDGGFRKNDLRTGSFVIRPEYDESIQDGKLKREFLHFTVEHDLSLGMKYDMIKLSEALEVITHCSMKPEISIVFTVKNQDKIRDSLLKEAAEDAHRKAVVLTAAAGVKLGELVQITYGRESVDASSPAMMKMDSVTFSRKNVFDIVPAEIEEEESVACVWQIR